MAKRPFTNISPLDIVAQIIAEAEELLQSAQALKDDLDGRSRTIDFTPITSIHRKLGSTVTALQDAVEHGSKAAKVPRLNGGLRVGGLMIPSPVVLTPWKPSDLPTVPPSNPPLPPILDPVLARAAVTHSGSTPKGGMSYERLEWIGDSYLYVIASAFIYQTFPALSTGRCAQYRETLVKNATLAKYTQRYSLAEHADFPRDFGFQGGRPNNISGKLRTKVFGDIFEAYVAGVILGNPAEGLSQVVAWVKALWAEELADELRAELRTQEAQSARMIPDDQQSANSRTLPALDQQSLPADIGAKVRLDQMIGCKGIHISYRDIGEANKEKKTGLPWFTVGAYFDGWGQKDLLLGFGSALSKKEAGARAAQVALNNKKLIGPFVQKKEALLGAIVAQQKEDDWAI